MWGLAQTQRKEREGEEIAVFGGTDRHCFVARGSGGANGGGNAQARRQCETLLSLAEKVWAAEWVGDAAAPALEEENPKLKQLVTAPRLDKVIQQEVVSKKA